MTSSSGHGCVRLLAALRTGTSPFMLAELYQCEAGITSKVIISSTLLSVLTVTGYLMSGTRSVRGIIGRARPHP